MEAKKAMIHINREGKDLFYTAIIKEITSKHIFFIDKYKKEFVYRMEDVVEIKS